MGTDETHGEIIGKSLKHVFVFLNLFYRTYLKIQDGNGIILLHGAPIKSNFAGLKSRKPLFQDFWNSVTLWTLIFEFGYAKLPHKYNRIPNRIWKTYYLRISEYQNRFWEINVLRFRRVQFGIIGFLEIWTFEIMELWKWNFGTLKLCNLGILEFGNCRILESWNFGTLIFETLDDT